jgi:hypothetical protein
VVRSLEHVADPLPELSQTAPKEARIVSILRALDPVTFFVALAITAAISAGVFAHASRHGSKHATAWGVAVFLAAGLTVPVYFIRYWVRRRESRLR